MTGETDGPEDSGLPPDEAFAVLGDESRIDILKSLGEANDQLSFSELYERVDTPDSGQFSYHLDKLLGHFVRKTDDGYAPGKRAFALSRPSSRERSPSRR